MLVFAKYDCLSLLFIVICRKVKKERSACILQVKRSDICFYAQRHIRYSVLGSHCVVLQWAMTELSSPPSRVDYSNITRFPLYNTFIDT